MFLSGTLAVPESSAVYLYIYPPVRVRRMFCVRVRFFFSNPVLLSTPLSEIELLSHEDWHSREEGAYGALSAFCHAAPVCGGKLQNRGVEQILFDA